MRTVNLCWEAALGHVWGKASTPGFSCRLLQSLVNEGLCAESLPLEWLRRRGAVLVYRELRQQDGPRLGSDPHA